MSCLPGTWNREAQGPFAIAAKPRSPVSSKTNPGDDGESEAWRFRRAVRIELIHPKKKTPHRAGFPQPIPGSLSTKVEPAGDGVRRRVIAPVGAEAQRERLVEAVQSPDAKARIVAAIA